MQPLTSLIATLSVMYYDYYMYIYMYTRGSRSLQNLVAISQKYCQPLLTIKAGCMGSNGKNWLLNPESSSQSEGYSSKWLIWLVVRELLAHMSDFP